MTNVLKSRNVILPLLFIGIASVFGASCSGNKSEAKRIVEEYMKNQGTTSIVIDFFYTDPNFPDKAYTSATVTYNFASSKGTPQRDFLGFILTRDGNGWRMEKTSSYTKDGQRASALLGGSK